MMINLVKYDISSHWFCEACCAWVDYDDGINSIIETYDYLDYLFDMETNNIKY